MSHIEQKTRVPKERRATCESEMSQAASVDNDDANNSDQTDPVIHCPETNNPAPGGQSLFFAKKNGGTNRFMPPIGSSRNGERC
jgi:hypothetical protein